MIKEIIANKKLSSKQVKKIDFKILEPKMIQVEYYKALRELTARMKKDVNELLMPLLKETQTIKGTTDSISDILGVMSMLQTRYSNIFAFSQSIAQRVINSVNRYNKNKFNKKATSQLGVNLETILNEGNIDELLKIQLSNQVNLIKSIPQEFFKDLEVIISKGFSEGLRHEAIAKQIKGVKGINSTFGKLDKRVKLIARNEIGNLNATLNKVRQENAGIEVYEWSTSQDEAVRTSHKVLNNKICKWSDPTVYADSLEDARNKKWKKRSSIGGYIGIPASDYNCRCASLSVFLDFD